MDPAYKGHISMWDDGPGAVTVSSYIHGYDETAITDEQLAPSSRNGSTRPSSTRPTGRASATWSTCSQAGDVWLAYAWQGAYATLLSKTRRPGRLRRPQRGTQLLGRGLLHPQGQPQPGPGAQVPRREARRRWRATNLVNNFYYGTRQRDVMKGITDPTLRDGVLARRPLDPREDELHAEPDGRAARRLEQDVGWR